MKTPIGTDYNTVDDRIKQTTTQNNSEPKMRFNKKIKSGQKTPFLVTGYKESYAKKELTPEGREKIKIAHAAGPITSSMQQIKSSFLGNEPQYDPEIVEHWVPNMSLSVADDKTGMPLTAAEANSRLQQKYIPQYFVNPMQDLDYIVLEAMARQTFIGPLIEALTKFIVGTGFKPELELINPSGDEDQDKKEMEENQDIIDALIQIDTQVSQDVDGELDVSFIDKIASLISCTNLFNRSALIFGYDTPIEVDGVKYKQIPSSLKFAHARDLGIIEVSPDTWRLQSVQWRNAFYQVPARDMIYLWNPVISAKTRNAWFYGDSMALPFLDASRVIRKNIGVNFPAMAEATWAGMFILGVKPQGQNQTEKQNEYTQIAGNFVRGGPNILMEDPEDWKSETIDFAPKVKEFQDLTDFLIRYCVASLGLPQTMFFDESQSNRATMIGKIQLATSTVINPLRNWISREISAQWYQRWFRLLYSKNEKKKELLKKFRIKMAFNDLRIEEWFDKIEAVNELDSRKQLKDEDYGELVSIENYKDKVEEDAEVTPGGSGGNSNSLKMNDGSKLQMKPPKEQLKASKKKA